MTSVEHPPVRFLPLAVKTMVSHTLTYILMGILAAHFFNYAAMMAKPDSGMRPMTSPWVMAGPLFQPVRGLIFALVFYPLREQLFSRKNGWLLMGWMLVALGILSTFAAAPGSIEGLIYTRAPILPQLRGGLEVVPQAFLLSALLCYWVNHPAEKWLSWLLGILFFLMATMLVMGLLVRR